MKLLKDANLQIVLGVAFMAVTGGGLVAPLLPSLIDPLGATKESIGLLLSIFTLFVVIFTPVLGGLSDKVGRKKVLVPAILLYGVAGMTIAFTTNFTFILILRALQGLAVAGMASLAITIIGDLYEGKERIQAVGYRSSAHSISFAVSPFAAGAVASLGLFYPFLLYALSIPLGIFAFVKLRLPHIKNEHTFVEYLQAIYLVLKNKKTLSVFYSSFHIFIILYVLLIFIPILLSEKYNFSPFYIGIYLSIFFIVAAIVSSYVGKFMHRCREQILIIGGFSVAGLSMLLVPFIDSHIALILVLALWAVGYGVAFPVIYTLATVLTPPHLRAGVVSGVLTTTYLGATASPIIFTAVLKLSNLNTVFYTACIVAFIPLLLSFFGLFSVEENPQ
jgi:MFS family permease